MAPLVNKIRGIISTLSCGKSLAIWKDRNQPHIWRKMRPNVQIDSEET